MREGKIYHRPYMAEFEAELLAFPTGKHDDIIDCLQMFDELKIDTYDVKPEQQEWDGVTMRYNQYGEPVYS